MNELSDLSMQYNANPYLFLSRFFFNSYFSYFWITHFSFFPCKKQIYHFHYFAEKKTFCFWFIKDCYEVWAFLNLFYSLLGYRNLFFVFEIFFRVWKKRKTKNGNLKEKQRDCSWNETWKIFHVFSGIFKEIFLMINNSRIFIPLYRISQSSSDEYFTHFLWKKSSENNTKFF